MKDALKTAIMLMIVFSLMLNIGIAAPTTANTIERKVINNRLNPLTEENTFFQSTDEQDGRLISLLQWFSPNGELPGTYEEYLQMHPIKHALFSQSLEFEAGFQSMGKAISILVDQGLYLNIVSSINDYIADLNAEGYSVYLQSISGGTPGEIKTWVSERYNAGSEGVVFIGDITAAWAEVSGSVFPCDLFFMDLDGNWEDRDNDGDFEVHTSGNGDMGPEVYVGRIYASTLNYDTEENMVSDYLAKVHAYRTGELTQEWRGLEYIDEDWYNMDVYQRYIYGEDVGEVRS